MGRMSMTAAALSIALAAAAPGPCQSPVSIIRAETAFTGRQFVEDVVIILDGAVIRDVIPAADYVPPDGALVIDAAGMTVTPGFIDSHVHVLAQPLETVKNAAQRGWGRLAEEAVSGVPGNREQLLKAGITAVIDMGSPTAGIAGLAEGLHSGRLLGPQVYFCGPLFTAPGGHPAATIYRGQHDLIDNATVEVDREGPAVRKVGELARQGASFIKLVYDDGAVYGPTVPRLRRELAAQITAEAHSRGLPVIAHVGALEEAFSDMLSCGVDGVEHCFAYNGSDEVFRDAAARGVVFTPTLSIYEIYAPAALPRMMQSVARAHEAGATIAAGTDFPSSRFADAGAGFYRELALLEAAGLSRAEVLRAATVNGARKIGKDSEVGSIAAGHAADLLLLDGDIREGPLEPGRIQRVFLKGKEVVTGGTVTADSRPGLGRKPFMVFPFGFYETVSGVSLGGSVLTFSLLGTGAAVGLTATYSFINCFAADLTVSSPSPIPATSLDFRFGYNGYPRRFFALSNSTALSDAVRYGWNDVAASVSTATTIVPTLRFSTTLLFEYSSVGETAGSGLPPVTGRDGGVITLGRVEIAHDGRDSPGAPWHGDYEALAAAGSHPAFGSSFVFSSAEGDFRYFVSIARHHVLAAHLLVRQYFGDPPFYIMPSFGGSTVGRGFQPGRFTGAFGAFGQIEYRFPIWSIIGADFFLDAGQVCADPGQLRAESFHLSGGAGLRFAFSERSILALDVGFNGEPLTPEGFTVIVRSGHAF